MRAALAAIDKGRDFQIYIALASEPKIEVLHLYVLVDGKVEVRLNIAGYVPGYTLQCWDGAYRTPKLWAVCTGPASRPPEPLKMRGFQGFRYTEPLW